jgi:di/tricarboxylate transporter
VRRGIGSASVGNAGRCKVDYCIIGVPGAIVGLAYMLVFSRWLLPEQRAAIHLMETPREYTVKILVDAGSSLVGQTIEQARQVCDTCQGCTL